LTSPVALRRNSAGRAAAVPIVVSAMFASSLPLHPLTSW
jgi:hypothetical protein